MTQNDAIEILKNNNLLKIINESLDIYLEIPHIAYLEIKKEESKALLFTNVIDKKNNKTFDIPVLMNIFCSTKAVELFIGDVNIIASEIESLLKIKPPQCFSDKIAMFGKLFNLKNIPPKRMSKKGECQDIIKKGKDAKLSDLPILTTWEKDGGPFITMGQVYTTSLDGKMNNVGMYRLQVYNDGQLGMHWQIHKDSNHFFHEYKKANKKMPVSIGIGGDPMYIWCGQAPLPIGVFELFLYGFIKRENAKLVKSITNDIYVPHDVDFVIEGFVDPQKLMTEGPFGDHTGYYTLEEEYPVLDITCITNKSKPTFIATVVGKPLLEDKYMGYATQRIFLPLLKTTAPDLIDYHMPENGVFHNLILAKIDVSYPGHAQQMMHAFWGVGQMSFVKHAIFVGLNAPELTDDIAISKWILNRLNVDELLITKGVVDALDHSSPRFALGGKLGIDCTGDEVELLGIDILSDGELLVKTREISKDIRDLKQYHIDTKNPITIIKVNKNRSQRYLFDELKPLFNHIKLLIIVDEKNNDLENAYMLVWRVVNNIDSNRDIFIQGDTIGIDATNKSSYDNFQRRWPDDVVCTKSILDDLMVRQIIDYDEKFLSKWGIL
jgi:4-hydroxy-3-polyprenylbenzoate decarboxylase